MNVFRINTDIGSEMRSNTDSDMDSDTRKISTSDSKKIWTSDSDTDKDIKSHSDTGSDMCV